MIAANILNVAFNWVLVFGNLGLPAMGASGSAWASFSVRVFSAILIVWYIWNLRARDLLRHSQNARAPNLVFLGAPTETRIHVPVQRTESSSSLSPP